MADSAREQSREPASVMLGSAEQGGVELGALVEPVHIGLPCESDSAVCLDRTLGCGVQKPRRVTVGYFPKPNAKLGTAGEVATIEFQ